MTTPTTAGIIQTIDSLGYQLNFLNDEFIKSSEQFDIEFFTNHSGDKAVSPYIEFWQDEQGNLSTIAREVIVRHIYQCFADKWNRLYDLIKSEYNALENYDRIEDSNTANTGSETTTHTGGNTVTDTGTDGTTTTGGTTTTEKATGSTVENTVSSYDSPTYVPSSKQTTAPTTDGQSKLTYDNLNAVTTHNTSHATQHNDTVTVTPDTETTTHSRIHGNIGVTTTTQMLSSEWLERQKINYKEMVYNDISAIVCMPIYV